VARDALEDLELRLLLEAIYQWYGYDFREYARSSIRRRMWRRITEEGLESLTGLQERILHDRSCMDRLLDDISVSVTAMFRDPTFFQTLREKVVPQLRTYPFIRIWNPGCATGEETVSLSILFHEEGLGERIRIYATDLNAEVLARSRSGTFPMDRMRDYTSNYIRAGGQAAFSDYYKTTGDKARFSPELLEPIVFAQHNLVSDSDFNEFHFIVCRNVMIYFDRSLQDKVIELMHRSLIRFGFLALGQKESLRFSRRTGDFEEIDAREKIYRRLH
jgi:chemotaxis protein methyltransferase CheR